MAPAPGPRFLAQTVGMVLITCTYIGNSNLKNEISNHRSRRVRVADPSFPGWAPVRLGGAALRAQSCRC